MDSKSRKKLARILELMRSNYSNPSRVSELTSEISIFLLFNLQKPMRGEDSNILFEFLDNYVESSPLTHLISIAPYFSHGLNKHKPTILKFFRRFYFSNVHILNISILPLVSSSLSAVAESNDISAQVTEIFDRASKEVNIHERIWKVVLLNPKARLPALNYLMYRLVVDNKYRAFHALMVCLQDSSTPTRKAALVLLKRIFPFGSREVESEVKQSLLAQVLDIFVLNERTLVVRALEWVRDGLEVDESQEEEQGEGKREEVEIIVNAVIEFKQKSKQDEFLSIYRNFLLELNGFKVIVRKVLMRLAVSSFEADGSLPEYLQNFIHDNKNEFWKEYREKFENCFRMGIDGCCLTDIAEQILMIDREQGIIEFMVVNLMKNIEKNPEGYIKVCIRLLDNLKKTDIQYGVIDRFINSRIDWKLKVELLIKFYQLSGNCEDLIKEIMEENIQNDEDKIKSLEFYINCNPKKVTKDDITYIFEYSMSTSSTSLLQKVIKTIPEKVVRLLKILVATDNDFGLECLIFSNNFSFKFKTGLIHEISKLFEDDDYTTKFLAIKWLNLALQQKHDIFSVLLKDLESPEKKSIKKYLKILETLKNLVKYGEYPLLELMTEMTDRKIIKIIEQFMLKPPSNSYQLRIIACELSGIIILKSSSKFSGDLVDAGLEVLLKAIDYGETKIQLVMIEFFDHFLNTLTYEAENGINSKGLVNIFDPLIRILESSDLLVRNAWLDFIKRPVPIMLKYFDTSTSLNYINNILRTLFDILKENPDPRVLLCLQNLTNHLIHFPDSSEEDMVKTFKKLLYFFLQKYIVLNSICEDSSAVLTKQIIKEIFKDNPQKFIKKIISLWVEDCMYNSDSWDNLERYLNLTQEFGLDLFEIFRIIKSVLCKNFENNSENDEKVLTVACALTSFQERLKTVNEKIWTEAISVYEKIILIRLPEVCFLLSYSLILLKRQLNWSKLASVEMITLNEISKKCIKTALETLNCSLIAHRLPYPLIKTRAQVQVSDLYQALLDSHFHELAAGAI